MFGRRIVGIPPVPEEWDFSSVDDPTDAEACLRYELAREVQNPEGYFSSFSELETAPFTLHPLPISADMAKGASDEFWLESKNTYVRGAGDTLATNGDLRLMEIFAGMYFRHPDGTVRAYPAGLQVKPWGKLDSDWQLALSFYFEKEGTGFAIVGTEQVESWKKRASTLGARPNESKRFNLLVASIDWTKSNADLIEGFSNWLEETRLKEYPSTTLIGRQSAFDRLNSLSALRLRHWLSVEDAVAHTKSVRGKALYGERPAWERAQKRAVGMFGHMYPGAGEPMSATKIGNRQA